MLLQDKKANAWGNSHLEKGKKAGTAYGGFFRLLKGHNYEHEKDERQAGSVPRAGQKSQDDSCGYTIDAMPSVFCLFVCFTSTPYPSKHSWQNEERTIRGNEGNNTSIKFTTVLKVNVDYVTCTLLKYS